MLDPLQGQLHMITKDFKYCRYKVCGKPHWTAQGLFSRSQGTSTWNNPKIFCDVICYAKDLLLNETGKVYEVVLNG